jgi:hypothetical protein
MSKKILMLACLFALIMPLAACGGGDAGEDTVPPAEEAPTESPS